jgi:predicted nucleic acid-binding protein
MNARRVNTVYLLDTDVLIDIQRGYAPALMWFTTLTELPAVPGFVVMELIQDAQNAHQVRQALKLVVPLPVVWPTAADCQRALSDFIAYHLSYSLGLLDGLIAACAIGRGATLMHLQCLHSVLSLNLPMSLRKIPGPVKIIERIDIQPVSMNVKHLHGLTLGDQMI